MKLDAFVRLTGCESRLDAQKGAQVVRMQVKQLCCGRGVPLILMSMYMAFGLELHKLQRKEITGETAAIEAEVYRARWVSRGLDTAVLAAIRSEIFNIPAPTP